VARFPDRTRVKPTASTLVCAGCEWVAPSPEELRYPFRCKKAGRGDTDHVVTRKLDPFRVEFVRGDDPNPFIRHREMSHAWHTARRRGMTDEAYVDLVRRLDEAIAAVDGRGFRTTPFGRGDALSERLGFEAAGGAWVKDETGNVSGSHKARHLMAILLYLQVAERRERPPLAIASCGNAALAAAVLARAAERPLRVFVPTDAEGGVLERLAALGAEIATCPREPGAVGDPCVLRFREVVAGGALPSGGAPPTGGALPFCVQGSENGLTIEGGETLGYEMMTHLGQMALDHVVIQVGGGALASSVIQAFRFAHRAGWHSQLPRFHAVQTRGAWPLKRAWDGIQELLRTQGEIAVL
jgi:threonine synthase